jgi:hypothetical protein
MLSSIRNTATNYKVVHMALVVAALVVVILRNHGILSAADVDAAVASLGTFGIGLNVNLSGSKSAETVVHNYVTAAKDVELAADAVAGITPPATTSTPVDPAPSASSV